MQELTFEQVEEVSGGDFLDNPISDYYWDQLLGKLIRDLIDRSGGGASGGGSGGDAGPGDPNTYPGDGLPPP
jgi:hypothetical protein